MPLVRPAGAAPIIGKEDSNAPGRYHRAVDYEAVIARLESLGSEENRAGMARFGRDFDSWDVCDGACGRLFWRTSQAYGKAREWAAAEPEFVRRAGFALIAWLAVHDNKAEDSAFIDLLPLIEHYADDDRNFVKKAVNWALRQIGKRNRALHAAAIACAERLARNAIRARRGGSPRMRCENSARRRSTRA